MSTATFSRLTSLLDQQQARYRVVDHPKAGKSEEVAKIRGTQLGQGAKALVCHVKGNGIKQHVLAILPPTNRPISARWHRVLAVLAPHWPARLKSTN
ncbi:Uncharacterized conserved protein [Serratia fonticola]|uniref:Uncharacterized conserved protein n=1 Tax=Serratia fonticola TaxID=47917 RepID=A0A4U9WEY6_SERFO|nr:Uncharacterized conserved protein [Serratia fonticola]